MCAPQASGADDEYEPGSNDEDDDDDDESDAGEEEEEPDAQPDGAGDEGDGGERDDRSVGQLIAIHNAGARKAKKAAGSKEKKAKLAHQQATEESQIPSDSDFDSDSDQEAKEPSARAMMAAMLKSNAMMAESIARLGGAASSEAPVPEKSDLVSSAEAGDPASGFVVLEGTKTFGRFRVLVRVLISLTLVISRDLTPPPRDIMCVCRFSRP